MTAVGTDLVDERRLRHWADRYHRHELGHVFTDRELGAAAAARRPERHYAVCFGAKEAVSKALGVGLAGMGWHDVESTVTPPLLAVRLGGRAAELARRLGLRHWSASFGVAEPYVLVQVVGS